MGSILVWLVVLSQITNRYFFGPFFFVFGAHCIISFIQLVVRNKAVLLVGSFNVSDPIHIILILFFLFLLVCHNRERRGRVWRAGGVGRVGLGEFRPLHSGIFLHLSLRACLGDITRPIEKLVEVWFGQERGRRRLETSNSKFATDFKIASWAIGRSLRGVRSTFDIVCRWWGRGVVRGRGFGEETRWQCLFSENDTLWLAEESSLKTTVGNKLRQEHKDPDNWNPYNG
jgi:hypothetical protein